MRLALAPVLLMGFLGCTKAQEPAKAPTLKIGDKAPAIQANQWLNGPEHKGFQAGKVYIIDFWAIWCGPCIDAMPHLVELQAQYKEQGLVVLPITTIDNRNPQRAVEAFVKDQAMKLPLSFGVCNSEATDKAYREAMGVESLPASFVVDKEGKLAYSGHPMDLDDVVPKVLAGTWRGREDADAVVAAREAMIAFLNKCAERPIEGLKEMPAFEAKYPTWAARDLYQTQKVLTLILAQKYDDAKAASEKLFAKLNSKKDIDKLQQLRMFWTDPETNLDRKHLDHAKAIAEAVMKIAGENDPLALIGLAEAYFANKEQAKAIEIGEKAVKNASDPDIRRELEKRVEFYKKKG